MSDELNDILTDILRYYDVRGSDVDDAKDKIGRAYKDAGYRNTNEFGSRVVTKEQLMSGDPTANEYKEAAHLSQKIMHDAFPVKMTGPQWYDAFDKECALRASQVTGDIEHDLGLIKEAAKRASGISNG